MSDIDFQRLLQTEEPLHEDLAPYLNASAGFPCLRHPLVYSVPHSTQMNAWLNRVYAAKKEALTKALADGNYAQYVFFHERPYRLAAFEDVQSYLVGKDYWTLLRSIYQDSENVEECSAEWRMALAASEADQCYMMDDEEQAALRALPDEITIWRGAGTTVDLKAGFSWTINESIAHWFALREQSRRPLVAKAVVQKDKVLAFLTTRGEAEIIVFYENLTLVEVVPAEKHKSKQPGWAG